MAEPGESEVIQKPKQASPPIKMTVDAQYEKNSAGMAIRTQLDMQVKPLPLTFGIGEGVLHFNYFTPQPYQITSITLDTNLGRANIMGQAVNAVIPATDKTVDQYFQGFNLGYVYNLLPASYPAFTRIGFDISARMSEGSLGQEYGLMGVGTSIGLGNVSAYFIGRASFGPDQATQLYWTEALHPWPYEGKLGSVVDIRKAEIGAEVVKQAFYEEGKVFFRFKEVPFLSEVSANVRHSDRIFGGTNEIGVGVSLNLDNPKVALRARAHIETGGEGLTTEKATIANTPARLYTALYLYGTGKIDYQQFYSRLTPQEQKELPKDFTPASSTANAKRLMGSDMYSFVNNFFTSGSFDAFASNYTNASFDQKITIAARLGAFGQEFYGNQLNAASPFSSAKFNVQQYQPQIVFSTIQSDLTKSTKLTDGICVNINGAVADFLRKVGIEAYGVATGQHYWAATWDPSTSTSYVINYGDIYRAKGQGIWPGVEAYAKSQGMNLMDVYIYGIDNRFMGLYHSPEGRLMDAALGMDVDLLRHALIRKKEPESP